MAAAAETAVAAMQGDITSIGVIGLATVALIATFFLAKRMIFGSK